MRNYELVEEIYRMLKYQYVRADILKLIKKERPELKEKFDRKYKPMKCRNTENINVTFKGFLSMVVMSVCIKTQFLFVLGFLVLCKDV